MRYIAFLFLLFYSFICNAQSYSISAGISTAQNYEYDYSRSYESISQQIIGDRAIKRVYDNENTFQQIYKPKPGYYISLNLSKTINPKWAINYGIGLEQVMFNYQEEFISGTRTLISEDTVSLENAFPTFSSLCDNYINSFSDIEQRSGTDFTILNLRLPLEITYRLFEDIHLSIGGVLLTPIKSKSRRDRISIEMETVDDITSCEYLLDVVTDHSGDGLSNLQFSVSGRLSYFLNKKVSIDIAVSQLLSHRFDNPQSTFNSRKNYKPLFSTLGVSYHFNRPQSKNITTP